MKKVILLHGSGGNSENFWFPYLRNTLDKTKFEVHTPNLPNPDKPEFIEQRNFVMENFKFDENTILVGHSAGCALILSILEKTRTKIGKAILVSGFSYNIGKLKMPILQEKYNWEKIKSKCSHFIFINSFNDPWGCGHEQGKFMFDKLGGDLIIREKEGHMGSHKFNQPYLEFPLLKGLIEN